MLGAERRNSSAGCSRVCRRPLSAFLTSTDKASEEGWLEREELEAPVAPFTAVTHVLI